MSWSGWLGCPHKLFPFFRYERRPVCIGLGQIAFDVFVEIVPDAFAVLQQQLPMHNLGRLCIDLDQLVARNAKGAIAAERRFILGRVLGEHLFVLLGSEQVNRSIALGHKLRVAFHRFVVREKTDGIVALDGHAGFVDVEEGFGLSEYWQGQSDSENEQ